METPLPEVPSSNGVAIVGPFHERSKISVDGYVVPYISCIKHSGKLDGAVSLLADSRFGLDTTEDEVKRWMPFVAHAMAIAAGRSCHGKGGQPLDPFGVQLIGISSES